jgi:hypothetical protein
LNTLTQSWDGGHHLPVEPALGSVFAGELSPARPKVRAERLPFLRTDGGCCPAAAAGSTRTRAELNPASGGRMWERSCSAVSRCNFPVGPVWVQPSLSRRYVQVRPRLVEMQTAHSVFLTRVSLHFHPRTSAAVFFRMKSHAPMDSRPLISPEASVTRNTGLFDLPKCFTMLLEMSVAVRLEVQNMQ